MSEQQIHQGRNVKKFREMSNLSQEGLAYELGGDWTQRRISLLEQKEIIDDAILDEVSRVLKVSPEVIRNFNEEKAYTFFNNHITNNTHVSSIALLNTNPIFNPLEKLEEMIEENKKITEEKEQLYQQLLKEKDDKIALLEKLANSR